MVAEHSSNGTASAVDALYGPPTAPDLEALTRAERAAFRAAVTQVAALAKAKLPESTGRIQKAVALALASDVTLGEAGTATVSSASEGQVVYQVGAPGRCTCADFDRAPQGLCKHRLAAALTRRATSLMATGETPEADVEALEADVEALEADVEALEADVEALEATPVEEPASAIPPQYIVVIQGKPFVCYAGLAADGA